MQIERVLSAKLPPGQKVEDLISWKTVPARVEDAKTGAVTFEMPEVEVPEHWTQIAVNIIAKNYFRKNGVPVGSPPSGLMDPLLEQVDEEGVPDWLRRSVANPNAIVGSETSGKQVFHRLAGHWTYIGWKNGYFTSDEDAQAFYDEIYLCLARQLAAPNSPQWFNTGLYWAYGITGPASGQYYFDEAQGKVVETTNSYERPQPHACFLTTIEDDLVNPGGIMDAWVREARIFKHGSGSGMNVSRLRAKNEKLSGGGRASGVMSWLRIGDSAAGAIQSGGTTRRAAKMVALNDDHPELAEFVGWKVREEQKAASMYAGSHLIKLFHEGNLPAELHWLIPDQVKERLREGIEPEIYGIGYEEEANRTIDGQNSNNSIRVSDAFLRAAENGMEWALTARTTGQVMKRFKADQMLDQICKAAWACADPGFLFHNTINAWNTCEADGVIETTNPCAEFHHLNDSACNLASSRLTGFLMEDGTIDVPLFIHVNRLWTMVLDISVSMAAFPSPEFAVGAWKYRTLGLGYADLGGLLMRLGLPYDSTEGRALAAALTSLMTGVAYDTSSELADELGAFPRYDANKDSIWRVVRNHARAASLDLALGSYEGLNVLPAAESYFVAAAPAYITAAAVKVWQRVVNGSDGFRNAQLTLIAPTGTISFVMDCDTTGVEPEFGLIKWKNLAGGGTFKLVNPALPMALKRLGYSDETVVLMLAHLDRNGNIEGFAWRKPEHETVFDCANPPKGGKRFLSPMAHLLMVAAVSPHISGAVSKTINMPNSATIADVKQAYLQAHRLMVKAVALYRDNCKLAQPLQTQEVKAAPVRGLAERVLKTVADAVGVDLLRQPATAGEVQDTEQFYTEVAKLHPLGRGARERPPSRLLGFRQKARIGGQTVYWRTGQYPDGRICELFIDLANAGTTLDGFANSLAKMTSVALQHGAPAEKVVDTLLGIRFEPSGIVEMHGEVATALSIVDLIARDIGIHYLGRTELGQKINAVALDDPNKIVALDRRAIAIATGETCPCGGVLVTVGYGGCQSCPDCGEKYGGCG